MEQSLLLSFNSKRPRNKNILFLPYQSISRSPDFVRTALIGWKQILMKHLHHGATSKTGKEVMEKKRHFSPEIRFPTVFPLENANVRCQK